jgi:hypothetical protein
MTTTFPSLVKVARFHLVDRYTYTWLVWGTLLFTLAVNVAIFAVIPRQPSGATTGALAVIFVFMVIAGVLSVTKFLPFAFALNISRRTYFLGTVFLVLCLSAVHAVLLTVLRQIESATNGWGVDVHFFRIPWLLDGSWYASLLTNFVLLVFCWLAGMWFGLLYSRFKLPGLLIFGAALAVLVLAATAVISWTGDWAAVGRFFAGVTPVGAVGLMALIAVVLGLGGYGTMRRITV